MTDDRNEDGTRTCPECDGATQVDCPACGGTGDFRTDDDCEECPCCLGFGDMDCLRCDGEGVVED